MPCGEPRQEDCQSVFTQTKLILEMGSGDGVTAARAAVFPPCAAKAMRPPSNVARSCFSGERWDVAA